MPSHFSKSSLEELNTCHPLLQKLFFEVIKHCDCTIIQGHRGEEEQNQFFLEGRSKLKFPNSKHNQYPSLAIDVAPYPIDWGDAKRFYYFIGLVRGIALGMGIQIRSGGDWDSDFNIKEHSFQDLPHFELVFDSGEDNEQG